MTREEFFKTIQEAIETDNVKSENDYLKDNKSWDSLAKVTVLSLFKTKLQINVTAKQINTCDTFKDILDIGNSKYE